MIHPDPADSFRKRQNHKSPNISQTSWLNANSKAKQHLPNNIFYTHGNGIDIYTVAKKGYSIDYENLCFKKITQGARKIGNSVILGPHLIDEVFSKNFGYLCRPDAIKFLIDTGHWLLTDFYEFKSGKEINGLSRKLNGFSRLLNQIRNYPEYLLSLLVSSIPYLKKVTPAKLIIPPDRQTSVTFISPRMPKNFKYHKKNHFFKTVFHQKVYMRNN